MERKEAAQAAGCFSADLCSDSAAQRFFMNESFNAVILCAGNSMRMGGKQSKIFQKISGKTVYEHTLLAFEQSPYIFSVTVVCRAEDENELRCLSGAYKKVQKFVSGGMTRQQSVQNALAQFPASGFIVIHDGARPAVKPDEIDRVCADAVRHQASALAVYAKDTFKTADPDLFITSTVPRENLLHVQTPQVFSLALYKEAFNCALEKGLDFTDDCQLLEQYGQKVHLVIGSHQNVKITTPEDTLAVQAYIGRENSMRIGHGYDVHKLVEGRKLILGGTEIPFEKGLLGHSDADVLLHAVSDALLGAATLGDIGKLFPDTDERYKGADSLLLLKEAARAVHAAGFTVSNIDCTVLAQRPKLAPYINEMRRHIAEAVHVALSAVSVKATTEEGLGFTGDGSGIAAHVVCLLQETA